MTAHVCRPLRLACGFGAPAASDPLQPWGHSRAGDVLTPIAPTAAPSAMQGAGGLSLSIGDYARFLQAHLRGLRGEDTPLLPARAVRELHRPDGRYALGWGIQEYAGAQSSVHAGGNGQFYALMARSSSPDRRRGRKTPPRRYRNHPRVAWCVARRLTEAIDMGSYDEAKANEFTAAATKTITGVALEVPEESAFISGVGRIPILWCVCVTEPCDCDGPIIWIEKADLRQKVATERRRRTGEELQEFKVAVDATVLIESIVRVRAGDLSRRHKPFNLNPSSHLPARAGCGCEGKSQLRPRGAGSHYDGQECGGGTLYDVWVESDGVDTTFYYIAVGSC